MCNNIVIFFPPPFCHVAQPCYCHMVMRLPGVTDLEAPTGILDVRGSLNAPPLYLQIVPAHSYVMSWKANITLMHNK